MDSKKDTGNNTSIITTKDITLDISLNDLVNVIIAYAEYYGISLKDEDH